MWHFFKGFVFNEEGTTAIEYALIAGLLSIAIVGGATAVGGSLSNTYTSVGDKF